MCGPNEQQTEITDAQQDFYKQLTQQYSTVFGENQAITGALTSAFTPILEAGPSQTGFSQSQDTAMRTQNTENVATDYAQAQRATAQILAAKGGGNTFLPSSTTANIMAGNANAAAATRAQGENAITQQNYAQGYQNWQSAASILGGTANTLNPTSYSGVANTSGSDASTSAAALAASSFAPWGAALGALGSIGGMAAGGYFSGLGKSCWIAAEIYGGWLDPRTIIVRRWLNENFADHWLMKLYEKFGERTADLVQKYRPIRWFFTGIFNRFLRLAQTGN